MRTTLLSALFVALAGSSVAASPQKTEITERISYNDKARDARAAPQDDAPWVELASATPASHKRQFIQVDSDRALTRLRIDRVTGQPRVHAVEVQYANGKAKKFHVGKTLKGKRSAYVDLRGARQVEMLVVFTEGPKSAKYAIYGEPRSHSGGVASR